MPKKRRFGRKARTYKAKEEARNKPGITLAPPTHIPGARGVNNHHFIDASGQIMSPDYKPKPFGGTGRGKVYVPWDWRMRQPH